ncbi:RDD family protein [Fulvivirga lutimaris]|uniref:RDD family protein n=1 Tax=Fulvivirga lutimaris TaxID=1819566 RepID=UPI0012BC573C|nr:RDD family protein [Fulvivirga lutimaris]MTI40033.1 RDD family protein [Fulvivirga lutimaris]
MFIKRIGALTIDSIILGILGYLIALAGESLLVELSIHGVLLGWAISTMYFAVFNSHYGNGQSLGKRALSIEVVNTDGSHLNFNKALIRSLLLTSPFFLLEYLQNFDYLTVFSSLLGVLNIAYYVGLSYFFLANTKDRRTIHDLLANTYVKLQNSDRQEITPLSRMKVYGYIGIIAAILSAFGATFYFFKSTTNALSDIVEANQEILVEVASDVYELEDVVRVESSKINVTVESQLGIVIEVWVNKDVNNLDAEEIYNKIMTILSSKTFKLNRIDYSEVVLKYGYDIGITSYNTSRSWKTDNTK